MWNLCGTIFVKLDEFVQEKKSDEYVFFRRSVQFSFLGGKKMIRRNYLSKLFNVLFNHLERFDFFFSPVLRGIIAVN